jgi:hypothetical protein
MAKRQTARSFAKQWRTDEGELCFTTSLERLAHMVHEGEVIPSFPSLNYVREQAPPNASADVDGDRVPLFAIGAHPTGAWTGGDLKALLREHGASVTGTKEQLLKKLAHTRGNPLRGSPRPVRPLLRPAAVHPHQRVIHRGKPVPAIRRARAQHPQPAPDHVRLETPARQRHPRRQSRKHRLLPRTTRPRPPHRQNQTRRRLPPRRLTRRTANGPPHPGGRVPSPAPIFLSDFLYGYEPLREALPQFLADTDAGASSFIRRARPSG